MARPNPIRRIMELPLPSITYQRRKQFRPGIEDVIYSYNILNKYIFENALRRPVINQKQLQKCWGLCHWLFPKQKSGSYCQISINDKWFCPQWFLNTLAHEMVHQYQWDIDRREYMDYYGREMYTDSGGHGPTFYAWRDRFEFYGLTLKLSYGQKRWFKFQDFTKC